MKKVSLLLLCLSAIVWGKTWDSFTLFGVNDRYFFGKDSLEHLEDNEIQNGLYIYSYWTCYGGLKHDLDYNMHIINYTYAFEKKTFDYATKDSIWVPRKDFGERGSDTAKFLNGNFTKEDFEYLDISPDTLFEMNTNNNYKEFLYAYDSTLKYFHVFVNLFVYQKDLAYKALCYRVFSWSSNVSSIYCRYQDDESWNFEGGVFFDRSSWNQDLGFYCDDDYADVCYDERDHPYYCHSGIKKNSLIYRPLRKDKSSPYKVNGIPASKNSSNIIIQNKKQPMLQLKGNR